MTTFDLLSAILLTAAAASVVGTYSVLFGRGTVQRLAIGAVMSAWFALVLWAGATDAFDPVDGLGAPGLVLTALFSIAVLASLVFGTPQGRERLREAPAATLTLTQSVRVLGVLFVLLYLTDRLPAPFAPVAGLGALIVGTTALVMAGLARIGETARVALLWWNLFGLIELVVAAALCAASAPGPVRVFYGPQDSSIMFTLPWLLLPAYLGPALTVLHLASFRRLWQPPASSQFVAISR